MLSCLPFPSSCICMPSLDPFTFQGRAKSEAWPSTCPPPPDVLWALGFKVSGQEIPRIFWPRLTVWTTLTPSLWLEVFWREGAEIEAGVLCGGCYLARCHPTLQSLQVWLHRQGQNCVRCLSRPGKYSVCERGQRRLRVQHFLSDWLLFLCAKNVE